LPECPACGRRTEASWRYCAWCAQPQRVKLVEFFRPHPLIEEEQAKALRVSRYLGTEADERHVRFSVWRESSGSATAETAVSLDENEAERLARFLANGSPAPGPTADDPPGPPTGGDPDLGVTA
jgi:hypothetical protein